MKNLIVCERPQCLLASFAMVLGTDTATLIDYLGHDGLERINDDPAPWCYKGYHPQEFIELCVKIYKTPVTLFQKSPLLVRYRSKLELQATETWDDLIPTNKGVIYGVVDGGIGHAVASIDGEILDPRGKIYPYTECTKNRFVPEHFFLIGMPK